MFASAPTFLAATIAHVQDRFDIWLDPFATRTRPTGAGQIQQSLFAQADGGLFGAGPRRVAAASCPGPFAPDCEQPFPDCGSILPAPHTDFIYAVITMELGLFGACGGDPDLRPDRRPRVQDRGDGPGRVLEAARRRA